MLNIRSGQSRDVADEAPGKQLRIAMFSIHSCPLGELGTEDTGGMSVYIREIAKELGKRGHRVDLFTRFHGDGHQQVTEVSETVRLIHIRAGEDQRIPRLDIFPHLTDFCYELDRFIQKENHRYDLIHSHYWLSGRVGNWARDKWHIPHIVMFHTLGKIKNNTGVGAREPDLRILTEKQLATSCDRIIASTDRGKRELIGLYGAPPESVGVVPCGVNLELFRPMNRESARRRLGIRRDETILLYVGRFSAVKGIDRLLVAASYLRNHGRLRLIIVGGDGDETTESKKLKRLSRNLGIEDMISFKGRIDHEALPPFYSAADMLVLPSHHESFGLVALESLACGTPVIATTVGAMEMIIRDGQTGYLLTDGTPEMIADKARAILLNRHGGETAARKIRGTVVPFSWSNVAAAMVAEYKTVRYDYRKSADGEASSTRFEFPVYSE